MLGRALRAVTVALVRFYIGKRPVFILKGGDTLAVGKMDGVFWSDAGTPQQRLYVEIVYGVNVAVMKGNPLGVRIERLRVEYPALKWDARREAFVARLDD